MTTREIMTALWEIMESAEKVGGGKDSRHLAYLDASLKMFLAQLDRAGDINDAA